MFFSRFPILLQAECDFLLNFNFLFLFGFLIFLIRTVFRRDGSGTLLCEGSGAESVESDYSVFVYLRHGKRHLGKKIYCLLISCFVCFWSHVLLQSFL